MNARCIQRGGAHSGCGPVVTILYAGSMLYAIYDLHNVKYIRKRVLSQHAAVRQPFAATARSMFASRSKACWTTWLGRSPELDPFAVRRANLLPRRHRPSPTTI